LGVEEQFYFVWPALLAVVAWRRPRIGAGLALAVVVVASFAASLVMTDQNPSWAFYMLPTRAWQLAAGGLLAVGAGSMARMPRPIRGLVSQVLVILGWFALAALIIDAFVLDSTIPYPGMAALVPTLAGVLLIASGTERHGPGALLGLAPIRFFGKISYSLYLWHWPILILGGLYLQGPLQQSRPSRWPPSPSP
jgi:peptidoglycan/LPS O-acetylase OafA/YrhL